MEYKVLKVKAKSEMKKEQRNEILNKNQPSSLLVNSEHKPGEFKIPLNKRSNSFQDNLSPNFSLVNRAAYKIIEKNEGSVEINEQKRSENKHKLIEKRNRELKLSKSIRSVTEAKELIATDISDAKKTLNGKRVKRGRTIKTRGEDQSKKIKTDKNQNEEEDNNLNEDAPMEPYVGNI